MINPLPADWQARLQTWIDDPSLADRRARLFVLIDGAQCPVAAPFIARTALACRALFSVLGVVNADALALSPLLVEHHPADGAHWIRLLQLGDGRACSTLLISHESIDALASRLAAWCRVDADGQRLLLRIADSRVLATLLDILPQAQRAALLGPTIRIAPIARDGAWREIAVQPAEAPPARRVTLDAQCCSKLIATAEADEMHAQIRTLAPRCLDGRLPASNYHAIRQALADAARDGVLQPADRLARCLSALSGAHP